MLFWVARLARKIRRSKRLGAFTIAGLLLIAILGNAATFYIFDGADKPELTIWDSIWYSIISVTTIGYGDYYAVSTGARLGMFFFVVLLGLSAFSAFLGLLVDWMVNLNYKEMRGQADVMAQDHILIINFPDENRVKHIIEEMRSDPQYRDKDVVLVTDSIDERPFDLPEFSFVHGSPLQEAVLERAGIDTAAIAIVLCTRADDPNSDGQVASVISVLEHLRPEIKTVAECLDDRHGILFRSARCDSIIYTNQIVNNILVQECQDAGVATLMSKLTTNTNGRNLNSSHVDKDLDESYGQLAKRLVDKNILLVGMLRDREEISNAENPRSGDQVIYVSQNRLSWKELAG